VVLMGLIVGNRGKREAMSEETRDRLFGFWDVLDELLNLLLFGLIGLEMVTLAFSLNEALIGLAAIVIVLIARLVSVALPVWATPRLRAHGRATLAIMTWGGLRGGISIALALSLPAFAGRDTVISATYTVVIFSILVQALTLRAVAARALGKR
jgi:CPA1 family monovalent cation:H+ antiporter